jgi:hypothetical protein
MPGDAQQAAERWAHEPDVEEWLPAHRPHNTPAGPPARRDSVEKARALRRELADWSRELASRVDELGRRIPD